MEVREEGVSSRHLRRLNSAVTKRFTLFCALTFYNEKKVIKSNRAVGVFCFVFLLGGGGSVCFDFCGH